MSTTVNPNRARNSTRTLPILKYRVDAEDCITDIGGDWDLFATQNDGARLQGSSVLQHNLWNYIVGLENRLVYRQIMEYVRSRRRVVRFLFRCDSPRRRRLVGMRVAPDPQGGCSFETAILRERPQPNLPLLDVHASRSNDARALCNWCMRVDCGPLGWRSLDDRGVKPSLIDPNGIPRAVFTICPDCLMAIRAALR